MLVFFLFTFKTANERRNIELGVHVRLKNAHLDFLIFQTMPEPHPPPAPPQPHPHSFTNEPSI